MNNDAHNPQPADSHGALDLSAAASAAGQEGPSASQQTNREGGAGGISNGPVSLPLPTVRREPVPAAGPGMPQVGVPEPVGQAQAADSSARATSSGPAAAAPRDL